MRFINRILICGVLGVAGVAALAADTKPVAKVEDKKAEAKKDDTKKPEKKLTEEEQAELEYKKYQEAQQKALLEMAKLASHQQSAEVTVKGTDKKSTMQTLTLTADNRILALVAPPRGFGAPTKNGFGEIHVFDGDGKPGETWKVNFHAHSLNAAPDGVVYVAGDGKVTRFGKDGKAIGEPMELPHITEMFKDKDAMRKKAEEEMKKQQEAQVENIKAAKKQFEDRIKKIEETKEEERTKSQTRQLQQARDILKSYEQMEKQENKMTVDQYIAQTTGRVRIINGIAISDKDVFVACGETTGWGYAIWRFDRDFKNPVQILKGLGGCCGQMDVQVSGADVVIAENTKKQFAKYDRDGKKIGGYGKGASGTEVDPACFGGCCNPMNTRAAGTSGDIYTAESEGVVKRFSATGAFIGVAATVKIGGGCKNVAIGVSADGDKIVFCDQPSSKFFILTKKPEGGKSGEQK